MVPDGGYEPETGDEVLLRGTVAEINTPYKWANVRFADGAVCSVSWSILEPDGRADAEVARLTAELERHDRADKVALVGRAERAEANLANADTVWRERHAHLSRIYSRQGTSLALHQARADLQESRAVKAERALVRFGRRLDGEQHPTSDIQAYRLAKAMAEDAGHVWDNPPDASGLGCDGQWWMDRASAALRFLAEETSGESAGGA